MVREWNSNIAKNLWFNTNYNLIEPKVNHHKIEILCNDKWEQGLGKSIAKGVERAMLDKNLNGVLISLADQPLITSAYLDNLLMSFNGINSQIVASRYRENQIGVPAVFGANYFEDLCALNSNSGAKAIIQDNIKHVEPLNASQFLTDLDTI